MNSNEVRRIQTVYAAWEPTYKNKRENPGQQRLLRERNETLESLLRERFERPLSNCRVLDVGCGYGGLLGWFHEQGVSSNNLFGIDLLPSRVKVARETYPSFNFIEGNAEKLAFPDGSFDIVSACTVFSSILDRSMARNVAHEITRLLTSSGVIVWYDMRYPSPRNRAIRAMTKPRIRELFPYCELELEPFTLLPPLARQLGRLPDRMAQIIASPRVLRSHYFGLLRPTCASSGPDQAGG